MNLLLLQKVIPRRVTRDCLLSVPGKKTTRRSIRSFNIPHRTTDGHLIIVRTGRWGTLTLLGGVRNLNRKCRVYPTLYTCSNGGKESASVGKWMKKTCFTLYNDAYKLITQQQHQKLIRDFA